MRRWHTPGVEAHWRTPGTEAQDDGPQPDTRERMSAARMVAHDEWSYVRGGAAHHMAGSVHAGREQLVSKVRYSYHAYCPRGVYLVFTPRLLQAVVQRNAVALGTQREWQ